MKKESKLNLNAGDYAISHCDSDKTYNGLEVHKMLCDAYIAGSNDTLEDDDERIKNSLINLIKMSNEVGGFALHKWEANEMLTLIEKQSEHANFRNNIQVGDKVTRNEAGVLVNLSQLNRVAKPEENKGNLGGISSNPAWSEEDGMILSLIVNSLRFIRDTLSHDDKYTVDVDSFEGQIEWLQSLQDRVQPQPKQEWSEEDDSRYSSCLYMVERETSLYDWLKSLKGRVQPKQEWNEEDDKVRTTIINEFEQCSEWCCANGLTKEDCIDWLKSLRPQNHWKPTDEQIRALKHAFNDGSITFAEMEILATLYEGLKSII